MGTLKKNDVGHGAAKLMQHSETDAKNGGPARFEGSGLTIETDSEKENPALEAKYVLVLEKILLRPSREPPKQVR
jgi:hypothetical protein